MKFTDAITPKNVEEIKEGLFIQKKGDGYRQVYPPAWNGKIIWKNFIFGGKYSKSIFFILILFLVWSYQYDVQTYKEYYETVRGDPYYFCNELHRVTAEDPCTPQYEKMGLCFMDMSKVINESSNTLSSNTETYE